MRRERFVGSVLASWVFPGFGQALVGQRVLALGLAIGDLAIFALAAWSVWMLPVAFAVRFGSAIDAWFRLRRPVLAWSRTLPAITVVVSAIGLGYVQLWAGAFKIPSSSMYPTIQIGDHLYIDKLSLRLRAPRRGELLAFYHPCEPDRVYLKRVVALAGDSVEIRCSVLYVNGAAITDTLIEGDTCHYDDYDESRGTSYPKTCSRYRQTLDGTEFDVFHDVDRPARDKHPRDQPDPHDFPRRDGVARPPSCATQMDGEPLQPTGQLPGKLVETKPSSASACELQLHYLVPADSIFAMGDNRYNSNDSRYWGAVPLANVIGRAVGIWLPFGRFGDVR